MKKIYIRLESLLSHDSFVSFLFFSLNTIRLLRKSLDKESVREKGKTKRVDCWPAAWEYASAHF